MIAVVAVCILVLSLSVNGVMFWRQHQIGPSGKQIRAILKAQTSEEVLAVAPPYESLPYRNRAQSRVCGLGAASSLLGAVAFTMFAIAGTRPLAIAVDATSATAMLLFARMWLQRRGNWLKSAQQVEDEIVARADVEGAIQRLERGES